jgi:hypothetical protein
MPDIYSLAILSLYPEKDQFQRYFCLEDNEIIEILLGTVNNTIKELDTDTSSRMIYYIAKHIHPSLLFFLYV